MKEKNQTINSKRLLQLTRKLVGIYSPSGKEEEIVNYLYGYLKRQGLPVLKQDVSEKRSNLIVAPSNRDIKLALVGHLDTITAFDLDDIGPHMEDDRISGLGAADMKGGCAAMIETFLCLRETNRSNLPVALILVVGEEEEGDGAAAFVEEYHCPWAVIGEPTDLKPCLSHYGYLELQLTTKGEWRHVSLVRRGQNAVESLLKNVLKITDYLEKQHPNVVYNIRDLFSSGSGFVVPDYCEGWIDLHVPPMEPVMDITVEIENFVEGSQMEDDIRPVIRFHSIHNGYALPPRGRLIEKLKQVFEQQKRPWDPAAFPSHTDANQLWSNGIRPIILGPGRLEDAHRPDESISFAQVEEAAGLYYRLCCQMD